MFNFKLLIAFVFVAFASIQDVSAQYRPRPDYPRGRVTCTVTDSGWEEHWGGHRSCGSCLQEHSRCVEKCSEKMEVCEARGTTYNGSTRIFRGAGPDRWSAETAARRNCEFNRNMRHCSVISCRSESRTVSNRSCR